MKRLFGYLFSLIIVSCVLTSVFLYLWHDKQIQNGYLSPLPGFLTIDKNKQVKLLDLWLPFVQETHGSELHIPDLTAKSVLMYDLTTNKTIFEKGAKTKMPMASLTKIMTAIISIENPREDDTYIVSNEHLVGEGTMGLSAGEVLTQEELLYGLLLQSGNDASEVIADNYPQGREAFIQAMNDRAQSLGLTDTHFSNPSGLQGDGIQYTTAYDLLVMTKYALDNYPLFSQIVATPSYTIPRNSSHKAYDLYSETNLLTTYEGVKGVKTGYTPEAGLCLVTYAEYGGHKIVGIILNSENRRAEMKSLLDYTLNSLGITPPLYKG